MKTYSREIKEQQYDYIAAINPIVKMLLPFDKLLMCDMSEVLHTINMASGARIKDESGKDLLTDTQYELVRYALLETNEYGHSTVLQAKRDSVKALDRTDALSVICNCNEKIVLNPLGERKYIQLWGGTAEVVMFKRKYVCKHVSVVTEVGNSEFYISMGEDHRIFAAWHSYECKQCKIKNCDRKPNRSSIAIPNLDDGCLGMTPGKPYEIPRNTCAAGKVILNDAILLGSVIKEYEDRKHGYSDEEKEHKRTTGKKAETVHVESEVDVVEHQSSEEVFIRLHKYFSEKGEYKGGHHNSPIAHSVDGYWRRKSKNDSTLIFVESFARGGTKEERDEISKSMKKKQVVYKV